MHSHVCEWQCLMESVISQQLESQCLKIPVLSSNKSCELTLGRTCANLKMPWRASVSLKGWLFLGRRYLHADHHCVLLLILYYWKNWNSMNENGGLGTGRLERTDKWWWWWWSLSTQQMRSVLSDLLLMHAVRSSVCSEIRISKERVLLQYLVMHQCHVWIHSLCMTSPYIVQ